MTDSDHENWWECDGPKQNLVLYPWHCDRGSPRAWLSSWQCLILTSWASLPSFIVFRHSSISRSYSLHKLQIRPFFHCLPFVECFATEISTAWPHTVTLKSALQRSWSIDCKCHWSFVGSSLQFGHFFPKTRPGEKSMTPLRTTPWRHVLKI